MSGLITAPDGYPPSFEEDPMKTRGLLFLICLAGCAPSRSSLFDPVVMASVQRAGLEPRWPTTPAIEKRVRELLDAPLTADSVARVAVLHSPALQAEYEELAIAGAAVATARAPANPELGAEFRFPTSGGG